MLRNNISAAVEDKIADFGAYRSTAQGEFRLSQVPENWCPEKPSRNPTLL